ncbi:MAG: small subunit ribosomal protein [Patescibacteria group bacterium]|nr:small subunit ribosomal protein [Patescibacteria group bacterium]
MSKDNIKTVTIEQMLEAGVHFGHQTKRKDPKMDNFVYETVEKNQIIDLYQTHEHLKKAAEYLYEVAKTGKQVIFIGTKRQASPIIKKYANEAGCLYVNQRWLGGTFTNFDSVAFNLRELERIETGLTTDAFKHYTKKERLLLARKVEKLNDTVGGLRGLKKYPGAVVLIDIKREKTALRESLALKIPVVSIVDTNSNPLGSTVFIPANDDAIKSIDLLLSVLASAIKEGYADSKDVILDKTEKVASKKVDAKPEVKKEVISKKEVKEVTPKKEPIKKAVAKPKPVEKKKTTK